MKSNKGPVLVVTVVDIAVGMTEGNFQPMSVRPFGGPLEACVGCLLDILTRLIGQCDPIVIQREVVVAVVDVDPPDIEG